MTQSTLERAFDTDTVLDLLRHLKYSVHTLDYDAPYYTCYLWDRKGLTKGTLEKRLAGTGLVCSRYGWDAENGPYMVVREGSEE